MSLIIKNNGKEIINRNKNGYIAKDGDLFNDKALEVKTAPNNPLDVPAVTLPESEGE